MCVRTKTSYGCGCEYKTTTECNSTHCPGLERYHYPRNGDCRTCKDAGLEITRGRDGKGRYGREISKRDRSRVEEVESSTDTPPPAAEVGNGISPWAPPSRREKEWSSHSRRKADDAWLEEHAERNLDLQSIRDTLPSYTPSDRGSPVAHSSPRREGRVYVHEDDLQYDHDDSYERRHPRDHSGKSLSIEIRATNDDYDQPRRHKIHRRRRQGSQESFESVPSSRSPTRKHTRARTIYTAYDMGDHHDSGYGSYGSRASHGFGAKTEPYLYSQSPQPRYITIRPPMPPQSYGGYHTGYGVGPVNIVTRPPMYDYTMGAY